MRLGAQLPLRGDKSKFQSLSERSTGSVIRSMLADTDSVAARNVAGRNPEMEFGHVASSPALSQDDAGAACARPRIRTDARRLVKAQRRLPAAGAASAPTSERTAPHDGHRISARNGGTSTLQTTMNPNQWTQQKYFGALDWARDHHDVAVVDQHGSLVCEMRFDHTADGWQKMRDALRPFEPLVVAVETRNGMAVEQLLSVDYIVYPVSPKSARRYRERKSPSGAKDDQLDAWSLADALRLDGHGWKPLEREDAVLAELRLLTRDEVLLIEQRTSLINKLQLALNDYYPAALAAFTDWTRPGAWAFVEAFPTPEAVAKAGKKRWRQFLHESKIWREATEEKRMEIFARAEELQGLPATVAAKSLLAVSLVKMLRVLEEQLDTYRTRIEACFEQHPDSRLFGSLPGAGPKLAPRLLAEIGAERIRFESAEGLQAYAGTAPLTIKSGQIQKHRVRFSCSPYLRAAVHLWVDHSRQNCAWAQSYYRAHREKGHTHACALRCLGQRWLKILWKMWQTGSRYDEALHTRNQVKHGSWLLTLQRPQKP
jgi:transposase